MNSKENNVTYVNKEYLIKNGKEQKSFKDIMNYHKGSITAVVTFLVTNKVALFLGGVAEDDFMFWLGEQSVKHPELAGLIKVSKGVISVVWNALVANPTLCAAIISALVAFGVTAVWGIKKAKLNHDIKKGKIVVTKEDKTL